MRPEEAPQVAALHREGIPTGILSELGPAFLTELYRAIAASPDGFVYVGLDECGSVCGFISGTTSLKRIFRAVLLRRGWRFAPHMLRAALRPSRLRRVVEAVFYPARFPDDLPQAELLSVVVDARARGSGVAGELMRALLDEFARRGVQRIKVMVGERLERANAYYLKHGFSHVATIRTHGEPARIYVRDTGMPHEADGT